MIRAATPEDLDALVAGNVAMALETENLRLDQNVLRAGVRAVLGGEVPGFYRVIEENGRVVAQLMITFEWSDWRAAMVWWIQSVYVWPTHRRRGLYGLLYAAVLAEARREGVAGIRLYVDSRNTAAQAAYSALGMDGEHYRVFEAMLGPVSLHRPD